GRAARACRARGAPARLRSCASTPPRGVRVSRGVPRPRGDGMSFDPIPSDQTVRALRLEVIAEPAGDATVLGVPVADTGDVPGVLGLDRSTLERWGFAGKKGQTLVVPRADDVPLVAVGTGSEV